MNVENSDNKTKVVLGLQGGGALGAYHIGAYQALEEAGFRPDWVSGISIGAINSAILVGNEPADRLERLEELWWAISRSDPWGGILGTGWQNGSRELDRMLNFCSHAGALTFGQPNFFRPNFPSPYFAAPGTPAAISFYDTSPMRATLGRLADFDLINEGDTRLSLGATSLSTGHMVFFDNTRQTIGPEHVLASGSLPPAFPPIAIDGDLYWDGGCISNTPLEAVSIDKPDQDTIVFMIDLWSASGHPPRTLDDVLWRQKQIQYANRTAFNIDAVVTKLNLQRTRELLKATPHETAAPRFDIVHIVYHPEQDQISQSDAEFSRASIAERRAAGYRDTIEAIAMAPWRHPKEEQTCCAVHRVEQGTVTHQPTPSVQATGEAAARFMAE